MKKGIALALTLASSLSFADPNIFGMELGKMTERELKGKYNVTSTGTNKYSNGNMYSVPTNSIDFSGLKKVSTVFDKKGTLVAVLTTLPKSKFDYLNNALGGKYKKVSENIPFVGNKTVTYRDGGTEITLDAPHMSFDMSMNYVTDNFMKTYQRQSQAESRQKAQNEASQL